MDFQNPKTILVVQIGKIGDMILTTPLFSEIKRLFPNSNLKVLSSQLNKDIPLNHKSVDEVIIYRNNILKNVFLLNSPLQDVDIWIDPKDNYSKTSELLLKIFKPKLSMGYNFGKNIYDISLKEYQSGSHAVNINLSPVNYFEKTDSNKIILPDFTIPVSIFDKFNSAKTDSTITRVLVNISAGNESRYLQKQKWLDIIKKISSYHVTSFTLIGLSKDYETIDYLLENLHRVEAKYIRTENILETAAAVNRNDVTITPDTSIVHICSAFDKPVIGLYPNVKWNLEKFAPLSKFNKVIISKSENTIDDIETDEVVKGYIELVVKINSGNAESRTRVRKEDH